MIKTLSWQTFLAAQPHCKLLVVGYSGGLDSHVLLHSLIQSKPAHLEIQAVHVHHGLNNNADAWTEHCLQICRALQVSCVVERVSVTPKPGESLEAVARDARYAALALHQTPESCLVTAHHGDDQVETLFLQLFRGAGVRGLSAMADLSLTPPHWRPLLCYERNDLLAYAKAHELQWIEDDSNQNCDLSRNFLRHKIIPELKGHWPGLTKAVTRAAHHQQDAEQMLAELAEQDRLSILGSKTNTLSIHKLMALPSVRQFNVLRHFIRALNLPLPPQVKLQHILSDVLTVSEDRMPLITWEGAEIRRFRDDLYVMPPLNRIPIGRVIPWVDIKQPMALPYNLGILPALDMPLPPGGKIEIHFPTPGLKVQIPGRAGHREFKKCCQEWGVPPWLRDRVPLLYINGEFCKHFIDFMP